MKYKIGQLVHCKGDENGLNAICKVIGYAKDSNYSNHGYIPNWEYTVVIVENLSNDPNNIFHVDCYYGFDTIYMFDYVTPETYDVFGSILLDI